jgi:hypothetical protein
MKRAAVLLLSLVALAFGSCGGGGGGGGTTPPAPVSITISPATATVPAGLTAHFTATVSNASNTAVTWQVNGTTGGDATVGTINSSGLYTAPTTVPDPPTVTVKAISQADNTKSASATVTITLHITVTPTTASVPPGGTKQFSATVQGVVNTAVNWQVNGVTGGNSTVGTISDTGLYTAPGTIPPTGTVTVKAVSQADTSQSATATVTIIFTNANLSGRYAFSYIGYPFYTIAGSFVANGNGTITSGIADLNDSTGPHLMLTLSGTYATAGNGLVEIILDAYDANTTTTYTYTLHAVVISSNHLRMIQFDTFAYGQGVIDKQDLAAFNSTAFAGSYAFRLDGLNLEATTPATDCQIGVAGRMTADDAGAITLGVLDADDCGVDTNSAAFTGTYTSIDANGRGTVSLDTPLGPMNFAFYVVSANKAHFIELDYYPWTLGAAEKQTLGTFSNASLTGDYAFFVNGASTNGTYFKVARFHADGSGAASAGVSDINDQGVTTENSTFTGTYSVAANGRGTATLGSTVYSFYMVSASRALLVQQGTVALGTGDVDAQQGGPFSTASLSGNYGLSLEGYPSMLVGQFEASGAGAASGTVDINTYDTVNSVFVPTPDQTFNATYSVAANGRGNYTVSDTSGSTLLHVYTVSGSKVLIIGMDELYLGIAEKRY